MKIAFLISAYKDPCHLLRLIESLPDESHFYLHIDRKIDIEPFKEIIRHDNVFFLDRRINVQWGNCSQVGYQVELFRAAIRQGESYDFLCTLSGMEYPVWSNKQITDYFSEHRGRNILKGICMEGQGEAARLYRIYRPFAYKSWENGCWKSRVRVALRILLSLFARKPLTFEADGKWYKLYKGSDWFAVTPQLAAFVVETWEQGPGLRNYFKNSFAPSETFVHTVVFNSDFASSCMEVRGYYKNLAELTPLAYIDYHPLIKVLTEDDLPAILASGKMFCRKIRSGISDRLVELLEQNRRQEELLIK